MAAGNLAVGPIMQLATIGVLGVGAQWVAWRVRVPVIVLMLGIGLLAGPLLGVLDPKAALGDLMTPIISIAVAVILFEGGLTLNFHQLRDASQGVTRLVLLGAPLGWITPALALHYVAGVSWAVAAVFGGIMIVTGPTVIAPLLRQAKLSHRPAALLQWEAIVNDPIGALAAVLAYEVIVVSVAGSTVGEAAVQLIIGLIVSSTAGVAGGYGIAQAFRRGWFPEYMKVPVLFVVLIGFFAVSNALLHESGLLAVTIMGVWIANANVPSYEELRRFKEHATVLLVSGVFVLLAASIDLGMPVFSGDVLSEAAEHMLDLHRYDYTIPLSENEAYNTLVTTDLAPKFGRNNIFQLRRDREYSSRHELPSTLGVRAFLADETYSSSLDKILLDWRMGVTRISTEYPIERFRHDRPEAVIVATLDDKARLKLAPDLEKLTSADGMRILHFSPPLTADPDRQGAPKDTILH